jgi:multiple sugar transport system substrate-binding protein
MTGLDDWGRAGRRSFFLLILLLLAALITACGGSNGASTTAGTSAAPAASDAAGGVLSQGASPAAEGSADASAAAAGQAPANTPGKIQVSVVAGAMQETMQKFADAFEEANPGTTVEVVQEPEGGAFDALIAAGNQPDIITGSFGSMPAKYASQGALVAISDLPGGPELLERFDERMVVQDLGKNYYVPLGADVTMMIYNKQLMEEAGLDPNDPPTTWAEFLEAAAAIDELPAREDGSDVYGTVFWNDALTWGGWYWNMLQPIYLNANQNQCQLLNRLGTDIEFDKPECKMDAFFEFVQQAQQHAPPTMEKSFFSRTIGMWPQYGYSWEPNLKDAAGEPMVIGEDVGVAPVPVPNEGDQSFTTLGGRPLMIMKTTPEREELAWKFVQFLMEDANNLEFIKELGYLPTLTSLQSDPYFQEPNRKPFVDALQNAVYPQAIANFDDAAVAVLGTYQEAVVDGSLEPTAAVQQAAERARSELSN